MATYNNQHWLLCHIRNSFISTDDTEVCETVMTSDDLPKHFLSKNSNNNCLCYPGLDQSDDEDMDAAAQSYEIHMCPDDIGVPRFRSNTTLKLDRLNRAKQKAAKTKNIKIDDSIIPQANDPAATRISDFFQRKEIVPNEKLASEAKATPRTKSLLSEQILYGPKLPQNKFIQYARFDGESQNGVAHLNIFLNINEPQIVHPMKICVIAQAKIEEVIGFICYKLTIKYPELQLQSVRHYGLYITEDNGEMLSEFPPLDMKALCQKYEFQFLTLAERRLSTTTNRVDYRSFSLNSDTDTAREKAVDDAKDSNDSNLDQYMERMIDHNSMIDAPVYRSYHLHIKDKGFFKSEVQLGISGERLEIYPVSSNNKFWSKQKAISHNMESIGCCEILTKNPNKAVLRIWYLQPFPQSLSFHFGESSSTIKTHHFGQLGFSNLVASTGIGSANTSLTASSSSPQHFTSGLPQSSTSFKHYDFETDHNTAQQILNKMNFILDVRSSATRKEFLTYREKRKERLAKKASRK